MDETARLRPAAIEDLEAINELAEVMDSLHRQYLPDRFRRPAGLNRSREHVNALLRDPGTFLHVAVLGERVVGLINAGLDSTPDIPIKRPRRFLKVRGLVVHPEFRRRGIGRRLFEAASVWAARLAATEVQLSVYDFNDVAAAFWQKLGFSCLNRRMVRPLS